MASRRGVGAVHVGRRGLAGGVVAAALTALARLGAPASSVRAVLGPAIGPCCYELPTDSVDAVAVSVPTARGTTSWGAPSLDLPAGVRAQLAAAGATVDPAAPPCTRCSGNDWFSHRADAAAGRQLAIVLRWPALAATG